MPASHASFSLLHRARRQEKQRTLWLSAAAIAMGCGVWATHFIAMLAYRTPMLVGYDVPLPVLSALIAVCLSGVGLRLVLRGWRLLGGVICGAMIGAMHYTGMAGFAGPFWIELDSRYVAAALAIGVALPSLAFSVLPRTGPPPGAALFL